MIQHVWLSLFFFFIIQVHVCGTNCACFRHGRRGRFQTAHRLEQQKQGKSGNVSCNSARLFYPHLLWPSAVCSAFVISWTGSFFFDSKTARAWPFCRHQYAVRLDFHQHSLGCIIKRRRRTRAGSNSCWFTYSTWRAWNASWWKITSCCCWVRAERRARWLFLLPRGNRPHHLAYIALYWAIKEIDKMQRSAIREKQVQRAAFYSRWERTVCAHTHKNCCSWFQKQDVFFSSSCPLLFRLSGVKTLLDRRGVGRG